MFLGDFPEDFATVTCMFTTHASTGAPVAPSTAFEAADVLIYKNGDGAQKATTNGVTLTSPFDTVTGLHCLVIDTSNDTGDAGFWTIPAQFTLVLSPDETVDSVAVAKVVGTFSLGMTQNAVAAILADTNELQGDWANGGRLDLILDARASQASVDTVDGIVDAILVDTAEIGAAGAGLTNINLPNQTMDIVGNITGNLSGSVGSVTGLTASNLDATISSRMPTTHLAATAGKLDGVALADTVTTYTGNTKQTADVATLITTVGVAGAGLTAADDATLAAIAALNNLSAAQVATELATYDAPTNAEMVAAFTEIKGATWSVTDTLEAIRDRGDTAWITATGFSTHAAADVWTVATRVLTANTNLNDPTAAAIADAVWDEAQAGHVAVGSFGEVATEVAAILVDTAEIGAAGAGLTALATQASVNDLPTNAELATALGTADDAVLTQVALVKAKTDSLTFTVAGQVDSNIQYVNDTQIDGSGADADPWGPI